MPHAVENGGGTEADDEELIRRLTTGEGLDDLDLFGERELDVGEKADDAENFEDIADDDLISDGDEPATTSHAPDAGAAAETDEARIAGLFEDDGLDDLFGGNGEASPPPSPGANGVQPTKQADQGPETSTREDSPSSEIRETEPSQAQKPRPDDDDDIEEEDDPELVRKQLEVFAEARRRHEGRGGADDRAFDLPPAPPADAELFALLWPAFEPEAVLSHTRLFPTKTARLPGKQPLKPPKPVQPSKLIFQLEPDQEKEFRLPGSHADTKEQRRAKAEARGIITAYEDQPNYENVDYDMQSSTSETPSDIGGLKWQDLVAVCQDWTIPEGPESDDVSPVNNDIEMDLDIAEPAIDQDEAFAMAPPATKKRKALHETMFPTFANSCSDFENPVQETANLAKKIKLDLNDPHMLFEPIVLREPEEHPAGFIPERLKRGTALQRVLRRYNISNDEAYDMLKENRQSKIRGTLGSTAIEHAMPAARLQYPFYKFRLTAHEARTFHRPLFQPDAGQAHFEKIKMVKRKHLKGLPPQAIFASSEDLSHADTSNVLLLEYSEEYPVMLSNFGMGSRVINYYRRLNEQDVYRPKMEVGDAEVLLSQDKSPFSIFGDVEAGETVPTISNGMYRAPIFKHEASSHDFLLGSSRTGVHGRKLFFKIIESLHVVGQQFPSVEVPGINSRKVSDATRKRLRMISLRLFKRHKRLKNEMIMSHLPGSDIAQNRSKLREFMNYDKDRGWIPRDAEVPDETTLRTWIKPEEICLLDSMQVGEQQLSDAGYQKDSADPNESEDESKPGQSIDEQLAPWQTTKNFLNACQGKAMLQLHGEGDPTGRGEAFNFIRTSMKGGFKEIGESVEDRLSAQNQKELGGHSYNVARQQKKYNDTIRRIWQAQKTSLSSSAEHDLDMGDAEEQSTHGSVRTPSSAVPGRMPLDDDSASMFSRGSEAGRSGRVLKITRQYTDKNGNIKDEEVQVRDSKVIREYMRRRRLAELEAQSIADLKFTGDTETDAISKERLEQELGRLYRNKERREIREHAKGINTGDSPDADGEAASDMDEGTPISSNTPVKGAKGPRGGTKKKHVPGETSRKCANCGMKGHIKTNKKLCPAQNGTMKVDQGFGDSAFGAIGGSTPSGGAGGDDGAMPPPTPIAAGFG